MPLRPVLIAVLAVFAMALSCQASAQSSDSPLEKSLVFRVVIGADGKLVSATPDESPLGPDIHRAAVGLLKELRFQPAQAGGVPVASETSLQTTLQFVPKDDKSYQIQLKSARLSPPMLTNVPPIIKAGNRGNGAQASGELVMGFVVTPDGSVDPAQVRVLQSTFDGGSGKVPAGYRKAATDAVAKWTFRPDRVAGTPVSTMSSYRISFCYPGGKRCDSLLVPEPSPEVAALPRSMTTGVVLPVLPRKDAPPAARTGVITHLLLLVAVDASGKAKVVRVLSKDAPARLVDAARRMLEATPFTPATSGGVAARSEMSMTVPVRDDAPIGGGLHVETNRISYDFPLLAAPFPALPRVVGGHGTDGRVRFRIVTGEGGRADMSKSRVESVEIFPNTPGMRRRLEARTVESMRYVRIQPPLVNGREVPVTFVRGYYICSGERTTCAFDSLDEVAMKAMREPPILPAGITLARIAP